MARAADPARAIESIAALPTITEVLHRTARRILVLFEGYEIDIRVATADEYGSLLFTTTGPARHVVDILKRRGPRLERFRDRGLHERRPALPAGRKRATRPTRSTARVRRDVPAARDGAKTSAAIFTCTRPTATGGTRCGG